MSTPPSGNGTSGAGDNRPMRIPLATNLQNRSESANVDGRIVNGYVEAVSKEETWVYKRPVLKLYQQVATNGTAGRGVYNWNGNICSIFGGVFYVNGVSKGAVNNSGSYSFSSCLGATPKLFFQNGTNFFLWDGTTLSSFAPGTFSSVVTGCVYLDGTMYVMDGSCNVWGSNLNDPSTWPATNVIVAQSEPCAGLVLAKQLVYAVAFKTYSTEMFYDAGNATGSPLGAVPGQKLNYGIRHFGTLAELMGVLLWVDQIREGGMSVRIMDQLTAQPCSTPQVERLLQYCDTQGYFNGSSAVWAWTGKIDGHAFYCLTVANLGYTLVYDLSQKMWYEWTSPATGYMPVVASTFTGGMTICQDNSSGALYTLTTQSGQEKGSNVVTDIYTPDFDGGVRRRKVIDKLRVVGDVYPGNVLQIRFSDNDFSTWSNFRNVDLGQPDPYLTNCGTFHRRVFHVRQNTSFGGRIVQALEPELEIGDL